MTVEDPKYPNLEMGELHERELGPNSPTKEDERELGSESPTKEDVKDEENSDKDMGRTYQRWDFIVFLAAVSIKIPSEFGGLITLGLAANGHSFIVYIITYFVLMLFIGVPLMLLQLFIGQQFGSGILNVWKKSPSFKGTGILIMIGLVILNTQYSFYATANVGLISEAAVNNELPWAHCHNSYNNDFCRDNVVECDYYHKFLEKGINYMPENDFSYDANSIYDYERSIENYTYVCLIKENSTDFAFHKSYNLEHPLNQYMRVFFDGSRGIVNRFSFLNVATLLVTWALIGLILMRGINKLKQIIAPLIILFLILLFVYFIQSMILLSRKQFPWFDGIRSFHIYEGVKNALITVFIYANVGAPTMIFIGGTIPRDTNILRDFLTIIGLQIFVTALTMWCVGLHTSLNYFDFGPHDSGIFFDDLLGFESKASAAFHSITTMIPAFIYIVILSQTLVSALEHAYPSIKTGKRKKIFIAVFCGCFFLIGLATVFNAPELYYSVLYPLVATAYITTFLMCLYMSVGIGHRKFLADLRETYGNNKFLTYCYGCWVVVIPTFCCIICILYVWVHALRLSILEMILFFIAFMFPLIYMFIVKCCCSSSLCSNSRCSSKINNISPLKTIIISVGSSVLLIFLLFIGATKLGLI